MPYTVKKNRNKNTYKVTVTATGRVVAYATKDPVKLMQAIEINKHKRSGGMRMRSGSKRSGGKRKRKNNKTKKIY
jgi:hypothetical protein